MTTRKFGRTALIAVLALSIVMSITGGTIAWFTDEVTSANNVIQAGNLDVKLYAADKAAYDADDFAWADSYELKNDSAPLFGGDILWEPGYTAIKYLKLENAGNLAFKWNLNIKPALSLDMFEEDSQKMQDTITLAKAIDVYVAKAGTYTSFAELKAASKVYNLYDLAEASLTDEDGAAYGIMNADDPAIEMTVALHMKEEAGNECQGLSISDGFVIQLRATQATVEFDSFGDDYDADAKNDLPSAFVKMMDEEELAEIPAANGPDLDVGYVFATTDTPEMAINNSYELWHADFEVSFDKDVKPGTVAIAGNYGEFGWIPIEISDFIIGKMQEQGIIENPDIDYIPAGTTVRLLKFGGTLANYNQPYMNYSELCSYVGQFLCGAYAVGNGPAEKTTMTVKLNLYEAGEDPTGTTSTVNYETGKMLTIGTFTHTFPATSTNP